VVQLFCFQSTKTTFNPPRSSKDDAIDCGEKIAKPATHVTMFVSAFPPVHDDPFLSFRVEEQQQENKKGNGVSGKPTARQENGVSSSKDSRNSFFVSSSCSSGLITCIGNKKTQTKPKTKHTPKPPKT